MRKAWEQSTLKSVPATSTATSRPHATAPCASVKLARRIPPARGMPRSAAAPTVGASGDEEDGVMRRGSFYGGLVVSAALVVAFVAVALTLKA